MVFRITNFVVVEITPIGLQNIGWRFWIVWTVLNAVFAPIIWFIYPETGMLSYLLSSTLVDLLSNLFSSQSATGGHGCILSRESVPISYKGFGCNQH